VTGRTIALTIVGFLVGMLAAGGIGVRVIEEVRAEDDATSLPAENVSSTPPSSETLIASSFVVPTAIVGTGSSVGIEYEIFSVAPTASLESAGAPTLYPRSWTLVTEGGTVDGGPADLGAGVALFELPDGTDAGSILGAEIVDPLVAYPLDVLFDLSEESPSAVIAPGVRAQLVSISRGGEATVVQFALIAVDPIDLAFTVEGVGPGWSSGQIPASGSTVELLWVGDELPDVMTFRAAGIEWVQLEGVYPVSLEGL
jgi:hypothetical protein